MTRLNRRAGGGARPPGRAADAAALANGLSSGEGAGVEALGVLDPAADRPEYWDAFRARVMERVAFELARRRAAARESVAAVLSGWSRSLVPVAVAAAAVAAVVISIETRSDSEPAPQLVLRDILGDGAGEQPFEAMLNEGAAGPAAFMTLVEGGSP